jgi:hypothetical protein
VKQLSAILGTVDAEITARDTSMRVIRHEAWVQDA